MKAAKPYNPDLSSSRRAQPVRQTRNNPPRSSGLLARSYSSRDVPGGGLGNGHHPERTKFYPAITYFADAITALPKELMRHFTLLKEVDAKILQPEENLGQLVGAAINSPLPPPKPQTDVASQLGGPTSAPHSAAMSVNGSVSNGLNRSVNSVPDAIDSYDPADAAWDPANIPRRQLFRQCALTMQEMLVPLDEKNHVISTMNEALNKQLSRLDDCFPHVEQEISEEARYGSDKHWAYTETRIAKPNDKSRKETGNQVTNGHAPSVDEAAARSDARKQALLAKKGRTHATESDFDDHHDRHKGEPSRKVHGNSKKGRPLDVASSAGLGATNGMNGNHPPKRRKIEKGVAGGAVMERSLSGVYGTNGVVSKGKINSPSETPVPEAAKRKAKSAAATNGHARKRTATIHSNAMSPSLASSPIHNTFADSKTLGRASPVPTNGNRNTIARARQNSTQSVIDAARQRPSSSASNRPNGNAVGPPDLVRVASITGRSIPEVQATMKESAVNSQGEHMMEDTDQQDPEMVGGLVVGSRKEAALKREDTETNGNSIHTQTITTAVTTTKSGRASKPSTPALSNFPEPVRSRSSRNVLEQAATNKRSHKKGAGQAAQLILAQSADDESIKPPSDEEDIEIDADEPTYCYCNGVSYGEMVACDAEGCAKEWFHLECVGLKVAPKGNAKWYCDDCKENMKNSKRFNGR